jgi:hypothetical protein
MAFWRISSDSWGLPKIFTEKTILWALGVLPAHVEDSLLGI